MPSYLTEFTRAYAGCACELSENEDIAIVDLGEASTYRLRFECAAFVLENADDLSWDDPDGIYSAEQAGYDFFLTRNGHGVGFWDRAELGEHAGKRLTAAAERFGEASVYFGDDGHGYYESSYKAPPLAG